MLNFNSVSDLQFKIFLLKHDCARCMVVVLNQSALCNMRQKKVCRHW